MNAVKGLMCNVKLDQNKIYINKHVYPTVIEQIQKILYKLFHANS